MKLKKVWLTVACCALFVCTALGAAACQPIAPNPNDSDNTTNNSTNNNNDDSSQTPTSLNGKEAFCFQSQTSLVFAKSEVTFKGGEDNGTSVKYTYNAEGKKVTIGEGDDAAEFTVDESKLSFEGVNYYFLNVAQTLSVTVNGAAKSFSFTIASFTYDDPYGGGFAVTSEVNLTGITFDGYAGTNGDFYDSELPIYYVVGNDTYEAAIDMEKFTATVTLVSTAVYSDDGTYQMDVNLGSASYLSDFYVKDESGTYVLVGSNLHVKIDGDTNYWECSGVGSDYVKTFYTITLLVPISKRKIFRMRRSTCERRRDPRGNFQSKRTA